MDKLLGKLLLFAAVLGFGIFYGVSMSNDGIERIHGPFEDEQSVQMLDVEQPREWTPPSLETAIEPSDPFLSRLFDKLGSLLHLLAGLLIRLLVGIGEALLS